MDGQPEFSIKRAEFAELFPGGGVQTVDCLCDFAV